MLWQRGYRWMLAGVATLVSMSVQSQTTLDEVVVSASRSEQKAFDAPGSIDLVTREKIEQAGAQINISEGLGLIPGINVTDRSNYAQDLQVSIRGFGSRAPFGVRGVRLMVDGLPLTLPDGQGQTSQFSATSTERIEVLKGPMASLYGNASGGLIQAFTREPSAQPELSIKTFYGSDELKRGALQYSETRGDYGLVVDYGLLSSEGFRQYSSAERDHFNVKLVNTRPSGKTTFIANTLDQKKSEDPGSLTLAQFQANPYQAASANIANKAGKTFVQNLVGAVNEQSLGQGDRLTTRLYGATRTLDNPGSGTTFILIDRVQYGVGLEWSARRQWLGRPAEVLVGFELDRVNDARSARTNSGGVPTGAVSRDEDNLATSQGLYAQGSWSASDRWTLNGGLRLTAVKNEVRDYITTGVDGSGSRTYSGLVPVLGATYHLDDQTNWYTNLGGGFETPTLNEVIYTESGGSSINQFNPSLNPARSIHFETGIKRKLVRTSYSASLFMTRTKDDIVPNRLSSFSANWQNIDTERVGAEFAYARVLSKALQMESSLSIVQGRYREAGTISGGGGSFSSGNHLPGIPENRIRVDLVYRPASAVAPAGRPQRRQSELAMEFTSVGKIYANSQNSESTSRYSLLNLRASRSFDYAGGRWTALFRANNLTDRVYAASVIGDKESAYYYEPGAPRNYLVGLSYTAKF
jgi:iron complex outermembrane receptor protein